MNTSFPISCNVSVLQGMEKQIFMGNGNQKLKSKLRWGQAIEQIIQKKLSPRFVLLQLGFFQYCRHPLVSRTDTSEKGISRVPLPFAWRRSCWKKLWISKYGQQMAEKCDVGPKCIYWRCLVCGERGKTYFFFLLLRKKSVYLRRICLPSWSLCEDLVWYEVLASEKLAI